MSHIVNISTQVLDVQAVNAACRRLGLKTPSRGVATLFSGQATGLIVNLPGWKYPVVCDTASGQLAYDNYGGSWGDIQQLHKFLQAYACEKSALEARKRGHSVHEQQLDDGSIKLTIQLGGAA